MSLSILSLALSILACALALAVGWKARKAHRGLWAIFESHRKEVAAGEVEERRLWQRCYGRLLALRHGRNKPIMLTAQHAEDVFLADYFEGQETGFFVEIGAYDGIQFSNTYAMEQMGWTGVLVEAHPDNAEKCRRNRTRSVVVHAAIGAPEASGTSTTFHMVGGRGADLLSAVSPDEDHLRRCRREGEGIRAVQVPCLGLGQLLHTHPLPRIDFLSIDIEGGEIDALRGLDFEQMRPRLILLEANNSAARAALLDFLEPRGYRPLRSFGVNTLFEDQRAVSRPSSGAFPCELLS
ncbi:MAG: FkbM family methyltransferase [Spartobacteria bacterium]|nr:FkbM family methyltransferase [Spartobacteria bacterium]